MREVIFSRVGPEVNKGLCGVCVSEMRTTVSVSDEQEGGFPFLHYKPRCNYPSPECRVGDEPGFRRKCFPVRDHEMIPGEGNTNI